MKSIFLLTLIIVSSQCVESNVNFLISQTSEEKLKTAFINLVTELRKVNSSAQNNILLSKRINETYDSLVYVTYELSAYNNILWGGSNTVMGDDNIILGSYDSIIGSDNFVFVSRYSGVISGDLIIENWKVEFDKRDLAIVDPNLVVSMLTQNEALFYGKYLQNYQPSVKGILSLVKDIVAMTNIISGGQTPQIQQKQPVQSIPQMQIKTQTLNNNLNNNPAPIPISLPQTSNQQASFSQSSPSSPLSSSLIPQILTPNPNQPSNLNLRTNPTDSNIDTPTINLSQSLLNKSWLPF